MLDVELTTAITSSSPKEYDNKLKTLNQPDESEMKTAPNKIFRNCITCFYFILDLY